MNIEKIKYTLKHKRAFLKVEKELLGRNTIRGYLHDLDKVFMYTILSYETTRKIHKKYSRHHMRARCKRDYIQQVIDWESAHLTKEDKPLSAYETMICYYSDKIDIYEPIMNELGLVPQKGVLYSIIDKNINQEILSPYHEYKDR